MSREEKFKEVLLGPPHCNLGKNKISDEFIQHVAALLKKNKIIKIKALKSAVADSNIDDIAKTISEATESYLLDVRENIHYFKIPNQEINIKTYII